MTDQARVRSVSHRDLTQGSLPQHLWQLSWPITISQALFMIPSLYDAIWLGQLGRDAQAAAGLAQSVRFAMISVLMGLSAGGTLGLIGFVFAGPLLTLAGADPDILPIAVRYARILFAGLVAMELVPSMGFMISSAGAPEVLLRMMLISTGALIISEPLLSRWMGIEGAALALVGSNAAGMLFGFAILLSGRAPIRLSLRRARLDLDTMGQIVRVAAPSVLQRGTPNLAMSLFTRLASAYGPSSLAAWVIVRRVFDFSMIPGMGLSRSAPALVGQNLGAAQPDRAERSVRLIAQFAGALSVIVLTLLALFAPRVMSLFTADPHTAQVGVRAIRILSIGYLAMAVNYVYDAAQAGAGDTLSPMVINLLSLWLIQVPLAFLLSRTFRLGLDGLWLALVLGWLIQVALMWFRYRQGKWKHRKL